jgi:HK97 family phage prohead protease
MPKDFPAEYETYDALTVDDEGNLAWLAAAPLADEPGFDGYLVPWYTLSDRGTFFVPGSLKKSAKEQLKRAPHLWQHNLWEDNPPIGHHAAAFEDERGFRISVRMNEAIQRGAEVMSALRFGSPLGLSIGFDPMGDRSGTEADDAKLDRRTAPDDLKTVPIKDLRAITEARFRESSSVVWGAIATAKPDQIRSALSPIFLPTLLAAIKDGTLSTEQAALLDQIVAAYQARPAAAGASHGTGDANGHDHGMTDDDRRAALAILLDGSGLTVEQALCVA